MRNWTHDYIGIPYKIRGRDADGLDCWGLICLIYRQKYKISLQQYNGDYENNNTPKDVRVLTRLYERETKNSIDGWIPVERGKEQEGDVILIPLVGNYTHVAICIGNGKMMHISNSINVTIEEYLSLKWKPRYNRSLIFRHPELVD